jgi:hypothetical protein
MLDEQQFLSPHGLRALSRYHADQPYMLHLAGASYGVGYEPGESMTGLFGGNSNWRGPIWFPVNYLVIDALRRYARFFGDDILFEHPTGSGNEVTLTAVADDLAQRLVSIFLDDTRGRRPVFGDTGLFQTTRTGTTCCPSTSTSTATPAAVWAPPTRPAGPRWSPT